jgi:phosphoribosylformylglycinamidine synthase
MLDVAHDGSDGGLSVAIAEGCIAGGVGADIRLDELEQIHPGLRSDVMLFSEEPSRIIVALPTEKWPELSELCEAMDVGLFRLGATGGTNLLIRRGERILVDLGVADLEASWRGGLSQESLL